MGIIDTVKSWWGDDSSDGCMVSSGSSDMGPFLPDDPRDKAITASAEKYWNDRGTTLTAVQKSAEAKYQASKTPTGGGGSYTVSAPPVPYQKPFEWASLLPWVAVGIAAYKLTGMKGRR